MMKLCYFLTTSTVSASDWSAITDAITGQISVSTVVGVLAVAVGAGIGLVFMWWGIRKLANVIMSAFRNGRLSI